MFFNSAAPIILTKTGLFFNLKKTPQLIPLNPLAWSPTNIVAAINQLKTEVKNQSIKLILADDLSYTLSIKIPLTTKFKATDIKHELVKLIPESIDHSWWQYKIVGSDQDFTYLQVFVVQANPLSLFLDAAKKNQLHIESIYSLSYLLLNLLKNTDHPTLIAHQLGGRITLSLNFQHSVIFSQLIDPNSLSDNINEVAKLSQQELEVKPSTIFATDSELKLKITNLAKNYVVFAITKNLTKSPALKETPQPNHSTLALDPYPKQIKSNIAEVEKQTPVAKKTFTLKTVNSKVVLLLFILLLAIAGLIFTVDQKQKSRSASMPSPIPNLVATPTPPPAVASPSPTPIQPADFKVEVLNGSGVPGEAGRAAATLKTAGFIITATGNADKSTYTTTQILTSHAQLFSLLQENLGQSYLVSSIAGELKNSTASAVVVIGKNKK